MPQMANVNPAGVTSVGFMSEISDVTFPPIRDVLPARPLTINIMTYAIALDTVNKVMLPGLMDAHDDILSKWDINGPAGGRPNERVSSHGPMTVQNERDGGISYPIFHTAGVMLKI